MHAQYGVHSDQVCNHKVVHYVGVHMHVHQSLHVSGYALVVPVVLLPWCGGFDNVSSLVCQFMVS